MMRNASPVLYVGPTISPEATKAILPSAEIRPPAARGVLYRDREAGHSIFVIIDGVFTHHEAVSPREVIDVVRDGALVVGASSLGAIRAAECWPVGMQGVGVVYRAFRLGILTSDGEVAVAVDPERQYRAVSVALVNVRYSVARAIRHRLIDRGTGARILDIASQTYYPERQWRPLLSLAGVADDSDRLRHFLIAQDIKLRDAIAALEHARGLLDYWKPDSRKVAGQLVRLNRERYDPHFGESQDRLCGELTVWLFGTGRYMSHVWPILAGHEALRGLPREGRATRLREMLCDVLAEILPPDDDWTRALWAELEFTGELHAEIARMYAAKRIARDAEAASIAIEPDILARVREEVSIAHDAYSWASLTRNVFDGRLCGAIPFAWIEQSCEWIARARSYVKAARQ